MLSQKTRYAIRAMQHLADRFAIVCATADIA